jgi:hypothetical protein
MRKFGTGAVSRPQDIRLDNRIVRRFYGSIGRIVLGFLPIVIVITAGFGASAEGTIFRLARMSSAFSASTKAREASFVWVSALSETCTSIPTTRPMSIDHLRFGSILQYRPVTTPNSFWKLIHSGSVPYVTKLYCWATNGRIRKPILLRWSALKVRQANCFWSLIRASCSAWASLSACAAWSRASLRCDSASAACVFADLMSCSNVSASCLVSRETCFASFAMPKALDDALCALFASFSALPSDSWAFPALSIASPDLLSASCDWTNAVPDLIKASLVSASKDPITRPDKISFLCPYGYATTSANTAIAKQYRAIFSKSVFFLSSVERCARISKSTSSAKNTSAAASKSLWARLTESSEFQSGINVAKCILFACVILGAFTCRLLRY